MKAPSWDKWFLISMRTKMEINTNTAIGVYAMSVCTRRGRETDVGERRQQTTKMLRRESESEAEAEKRVCTAAYTGSNYRVWLKLNAKLQWLLKHLNYNFTWNTLRCSIWNKLPHLCRWLAFLPRSVSPLWSIGQLSINTVKHWVPSKLMSHILFVSSEQQRDEWDGESANKDE